MSSYTFGDVAVEVPFVLLGRGGERAKCVCGREDLCMGEKM